VRIFKNTWFTRFAGKEGITDGELREMVNDVLETGQADANLGGDVYKIRFAMSGHELAVAINAGEFIELEEAV